MKLELSCHRQEGLEIKMRILKKQISVGNIEIGCNAPISVQSMLNVEAHDFENSVIQAKALEIAGCEIIRAAIPDMKAIPLIYKLKENLNTPIVADIHFDYKLAIESVYAGVDKIRINPGNIGSPERVAQVVKACRDKNIPIRIGVNSGSLEKHILAKHQAPTPEALLESALYHVNMLEQLDFTDIILSLKSSNLTTMLAAYRLASEAVNYPLHLGVTEAGTERMGLIKSAIGIGSLLADGIGDTIRVSLTADPIKEIPAARDILKAVGANGGGVEIISCPTCGRTKIGLISLANEVEARLSTYKGKLKVAVMGCVVNGPGEAKEADIGIAGGDKEGIIFQKGEIVGKFPQERLIDELMIRIDAMKF